MELQLYRVLDNDCTVSSFGRSQCFDGPFGVTQRAEDGLVRPSLHPLAFWVQRPIIKQLEANRRLVSCIPGIDGI